MPGDFAPMEMSATNAAHVVDLQQPDGSADGDSEPCGKDVAGREQHRSESDEREHPGH